MAKKPSRPRDEISDSEIESTRLDLTQRIEAFRIQLGTLREFDTELPVQNRQGDDPMVGTISKTWTEISHKAIDFYASDLLQPIYEWEEWKNYRRLRGHSSSYVAWKKKKDAERYAKLTEEQKDKRAAKARKARGDQWWHRNKDELTNQVRLHGGALKPPLLSVLRQLRRRYPEHASTLYLHLQLRAAIDNYDPAREETLRPVKTLFERQKEFSWEQVKARLNEVAIRKTNERKTEEESRRAKRIRVAGYDYRPKLEASREAIQESIRERQRKRDGDLDETDQFDFSSEGNGTDDPELDPQDEREDEEHEDDDHEDDDYQPNEYEQEEAP